MPIETFITDPQNKLQCQIDAPNNERHGLIVSSRELKQYKYINTYFLNETYGIDMNQNGSIDPNISELIYDEDTGAPGEWDWSVISGTWDLASVLNPYTGVISINGTATTDGSTIEGDSGTSFDLSNYTNLVGYIYLTSWKLSPGVNELNAYGWDNAGIMIGNSVDITDYINTAVLNTWQKFIIPLSDMGLTGREVDTVRIQHVTTLGVPNQFFLDRIDFEGITGDTTGVLDYIIQPTHYDEWWHVCSINMIFVNNWPGTLADATMPNIPYDSFIGVGPLINGILIKTFSDGELTLNANFQNLFDFLSLTPAYVSSSGSDGVNTWFKIDLPFVWPVILKSEKEDKIIISIRDDLTGLIGLRTSACGRIEDRLVNV